MLEQQLDAIQDRDASQPRRHEKVSTSVRAAFEARLHAGGVIGALGLLNQRTRFRFTGLYRVVPPELHNVALFDRENPALNVSGGVCGIRETFCSIVQESARPFQMRDRLADAQLRSHPTRESVQSYVGVPVRLSGGLVLGTLCHFDGRPRIIARDELRVLQAVAPLLVSWLAVSATATS